MIRRRFLGLMTMGGAGGIAALAAVSGRAHRNTVTYAVAGFTCVTCATGLEVLLQKERGVLTVRATYPRGEATVAFNSKLTTEETIRRFIEGLGFRATPRQVSLL